jgi:hypothetical protein
MQTEPDASLPGQISSNGVLLSVGIPKGRVLPNLDDEEGEPTQWVRADGETLPLSERVFDVWVRAMRGISRSELISSLVSEGGPAGDELVEGLEEVGLLLDITPYTTGESLADVRVIPVALGIGNHEVRRDVYIISDLGLQTAAEVDAVSFGLWEEFDGITTIASACEAVAQNSGLNKTAVLSHVPGLLVALMRMRYVFIDGTVDHAAIRA